MGVYIKGMEMPQNCFECVCYNGEWSVCRALVKAVRILQRPEDCPLIPVPPHGRLIDADEIANHKFIAVDGPDDGSIYRAGWNNAIEAIMEYAPTIIPAEEG